MAYTRPLDDIRVGGEIDAMCTRCRMLTNHRIVALVDGTVKRVICLTCQSQHNYRQAPGAKKSGSGTTIKRVSKEQKKTSAPDGGRIFAQWLGNKNNLTEDPIPYSIKHFYETGQAVDHPKFGLGFVKKIIPPNKVEIMFEKEVKTLAMNTGL